MHVVWTDKKGRDHNAHVDFVVNCLSRRDWFGRKNWWRTAEDSKRTERGAVAESVDCTFVPFVATEQGHLGPEASTFLRKLEASTHDESDPHKGMSEISFRYWVARMARAVIVGTHHIAKGYRQRTAYRERLEPIEV